jgi:hypothetical protein
MAEFSTEFEYARRPSIPEEEEAPMKKTTSQSDSVGSADRVSLKDSLQDGPESFEDIDFSDTARLTENVSAPSGFENYNQEHRHSQPNLPQPFEPAPISPKVDQRNRRLSNIAQFGRKDSVRIVSKAIRRMSRRVVNVQNNDNFANQPPHLPLRLGHPDMDEHVDQTKKHGYASTENDSIDEAIPMTPTTSKADNNVPNSSRHNNIPTDNINSIHSKDHKIQLAGNSLRYLSPNNPLRRAIAKLLCWR